MRRAEYKALVAHRRAVNWKALSWRRKRQQKALATGDPIVADLPEEFAGQLTITANGCWRWHGAKRTDGRPLCRGKEYVYRALFVALRPTPLEPGEILHHKECGQYWCANPWHTEPMTQNDHQKETMRLRGNGGARAQAKKTHCPAGHPYDDENTYRHKGERQCKRCMRERGRQQYYAHLEENRRKARERLARKREHVGASAGTAVPPAVFVPLKRPRWDRDTDG